MTLSMILARDLEGCIGRGQNIPWRLTDDFKHFKKTTMGSVLIVGRKTFDTLPHLPGRKIVVISRKESSNPNWVNTKDQAIARANELGDRIFIAGGAEIYEMFIDDVDELHVTTVDAKTGGNIIFNKSPSKRMEAVNHIEFPAGRGNQYAFTVTHLKVRN